MLTALPTRVANPVRLGACLGDTPSALLTPLFLDVMLPAAQAHFLEVSEAEAGLVAAIAGLADDEGASLTAADVVRHAVDCARRWYIAQALARSASPAEAAS